MIFSLFILFLTENGQSKGTALYFRKLYDCYTQRKKLNKKWRRLIIKTNNYKLKQKRNVIKTENQLGVATCKYNLRDWCWWLQSHDDTTYLHWLFGPIKLLYFAIFYFTFLSLNAIESPTIIAQNVEENGFSNWQENI